MVLLGEEEGEGANLLAHLPHQQAFHHVTITTVYSASGGEETQPPPVPDKDTLMLRNE